MPLCLQNYPDAGSAKRASVVSLESLVIRKRNWATIETNVLNIRAPIVKCPEHNKLNIWDQMLLGHLGPFTRTKYAFKTEGTVKPQTAVLSSELSL